MWLYLTTIFSDLHLYMHNNGIISNLNIYVYKTLSDKYEYLRIHLRNNVTYKMHKYRPGGVTHI